MKWYLPALVVVGYAVLILVAVLYAVASTV